MAKLPNFFIVGAPKAGTTSLYHYLDQHPQIYMSAIKEPHYFSAETRLENFDPELTNRVARENGKLRKFLTSPMQEKRFSGLISNWEDYVRLFANAENESARGEASVCYLWSPTAPQSIAAKIPGAKFIVMLRDPADRAFSQYLHGLADGIIRWSFREHIQRNMRHRSEQCSIHYPFLEFGMYSDQLRRYKQRFGENVWVGFHEDFKRQPVETYQKVCEFLGVSQEFQPSMERRYLEAQVPRLGAIAALKKSGIWRAAAAAAPNTLRPLIRRAIFRKPGTALMDPNDRQFLIDFYREDILKLASLVNRDLDCWLLPTARSLS